jgi:HEAT repeat protein
VLAGLVVVLGRAEGFGDKLSADPIEEFHKALQLEKSDSLDNRLEGRARKLALDFRKKNLNRAAANLRSLSDIAQALLLPTWPIEDTSDYDQAARDVDNEVREALLDRFIKGTRAAFRDGTPSRQAAVAILLGETAIASATDLDRSPLEAKDRAKRMADTRENLFRELSRLTPDLAKLTSSSSPLVRGAAARALGQFPRRPYTVAQALDRVLAGDKEHVSNRREAANSLVTLVQTVTGTEPNVPSEPGILTRETRRNKRLFSAKDRVQVWAAVIPVASRGLRDSDTRVRRASISAIQQATAALALEVYFTSRDPVLKTFPPKERKELTPAERRRVLEGYKEIERFEESIKPAIAALTVSKVGGVPVREALVSAAGDPDLQVRLGVRRTFDEMARARRFLLDLRGMLPPVEKGKADNDPEKLDAPKNEKKKDDKEEVSRREPTAALKLVAADEEIQPPLRLPPPDNVIDAQNKGKDDKDRNDKKKDDKDKDEKLNAPKNDKEKNALDAKKDKEEDDDPFKDVKVDRDALGKALVEMGENVIRRGAVDTNAAGRRAALEAVEALGETGATFIPHLVRSLKDPDRFVRWIAARTLGKLAPKSASTVVPGLVCMLDDQDLDARIAAIDALGLYNSSAAGAVPALARHLGKGDSESRIAVMRALENVGKAATPALKAVRPLLSMQDPRLRAEAARLLGRFGADASDYLPDLRKMLNDPDSEVRRQASAAIIAITDR